MGRGTYEHNYTQLNLPALAETVTMRPPSPSPCLTTLAAPASLV